MMSYDVLSCFMMFYEFYDVLWCFMMFYDVLWCFMMSYDVLWCLMMSYDVLRRFMMSYDVLWWFMMFYDVLWCLMMSYDVLWCFMMSYDVLWCFMMFYDVLWCFMMFYDVLWCLMMFYDVLWCFMMFYDVLWCFMMFYDVLWYFMMFYDVLWCFMMFYDVLWCFMICYDVLWCFFDVLWCFGLLCSWNWKGWFPSPRTQSIKSEVTYPIKQNHKWRSWTLKAVPISNHPIARKNLGQSMSMAVFDFKWFQNLSAWDFLSLKRWCRLVSQWIRSPTGSWWRQGARYPQGLKASKERLLWVRSKRMTRKSGKSEMKNQRDLIIGNEGRIHWNISMRKKKLHWNLLKPYIQQFTCQQLAVPTGEGGISIILCWKGPWPTIYPRHAKLFFDACASWERASFEDLAKTGQEDQGRRIIWIISSWCKCT